MKILIKPVLLEFSDEDRYYQQVPYSDCETELLNMFYDSDIKFDFEKFPNSIFVFKNDEFICEYDIKNGELWCSYLIWQFFRKKYELNDLKITNLIKGVAEEYFKNMEVTPINRSKTPFKKVEEHFKKKVKSYHEKNYLNPTIKFLFCFLCREYKTTYTNINRNKASSHYNNIWTKYSYCSFD